MGNGSDEPADTVMYVAPGPEVTSNHAGLAGRARIPSAYGLRFRDAQELLDIVRRRSRHRRATGHTRVPVYIC